MIVAGGGALYSAATEALATFASRHRVPVAETQAGKSALAWDHPQAVGAIGVTGSSAANALAREADLILSIATRLQDFTTGSRALLPGTAKLIQLNVTPLDSGKHRAVPLTGDARRTLGDLSAALGEHASTPAWQARRAALIAEWNGVVDHATAASSADLPTDAQVVGAVNRASGEEDVVVCAAGGLPGELHKLWRARRPNGYHMEYGFSCMGYEIAGAMGIKMAEPTRDVVCMVGDGSYMMMNSEMATAAMLGTSFTTVITDNRGYGCINRLQMGTGGAEFNNLYAHARIENQPQIDFAAHAAAMGATAVKVGSIAELEAALARRTEVRGPYVIVIDTDPYPSTPHGGHWWDVAVPEVSARPQVRDARATYIKKRKDQS